jgi:DNA-binding SARP family transcriptional activator/tetratricopeptide (TPR) repeat protein
MEIRLLGPVEVIGPRGHAMLSGGRQRALVSALALNAGAVVASSRLVDALWGPEPPRTAFKTLHGHVARLRRALLACGLQESLVTRGSGYALAIARNGVDGLYFEDLVATARLEMSDSRCDSAVQRLRTGFALWRGEPVQDGELFGWGAAEVLRLQELRLTATEDLCDAELRIGHPGVAIIEAERALVHAPMRERLVELLMLALSRVGRPADALDAYQRLRRRLADELGVDPSSAVDRVYVAILRQDADAVQPHGEPAAPRPAQLPPRVGYFTGRAEQLRALNEAPARPLDSGIVVVSGAGGMGKTALVTQWAHGMRELFPDGQIFVDLRGHDDKIAMTAAAVLTHTLRALGVPEDRMPGEASGQVDLLRSMLDGRRVLIVLDNAASADQVLPLVPPSPGSVLVVTSRRPMSALTAYHSVSAISLDPLTTEESLTLLREVVGRRRIDREPAAAARIAASCAGLPLALRIAAAKLVHEPNQALVVLASELSTVDRLDALHVDGDSRSVRTVFASAYRALSPRAALLFRRLGLHPGADLGSHLAAAVADLSPAGTEQALAELVDAHLLADSGDGRFHFHDLIGLYAAECARLDEQPSARAATLDRLIGWYLAIATSANRVLDPRHDEATPTLTGPLMRPPFELDPQSTLAYLDGERANLLPVVRLAAQNGRDVASWQLTYQLTGFFDSRGEWIDRIEMCRIGLAAAARIPDPTGESLMGSALGMAYIRMLRFAEALDYLYPALELANAAGNERGAGRIRSSIATAYARLRRYDEAVETYQRALASHLRNDDRSGVAVALNNIGIVRVRQGHPELSFPHLTEALRLTEEAGDRRMKALVLGSIGEAHVAAGQRDAALDSFRAALAVQREIDDRRHQVDTMVNIAGVLLSGDDQDDHAAAAEHLHAALQLSRDLGDQHLISVCLRSLAEAHLRRGEFDAAGECLRRALAIRAAMPDAYEEAAIHRGMARLARQAGEDTVADEHRLRAVWLYHKANAASEAAKLESAPA